MKQILSAVTIGLFCWLSWGQSGSGGNTQLLAIAQGISSPSMTNLTLVSNGFTAENPVGASYQGGYRGTLEIDGNDPTNFGLEAGLGDAQYGLALSYYSNGCDNCDSLVRGSLSAIWDWFGLGFGVAENLFSIGILLYPQEVHRFGFIVHYDDPNGPSNKFIGTGFGYSYVIPSFTFSIDLSHRGAETGAIGDGAMMISPGVAVRINEVSVSISHDFFFSDNGNYSDKFWFGIGYGDEKDWHVALYGEYTNQWSLVGSYFF